MAPAGLLYLPNRELFTKGTISKGTIFSDSYRLRLLFGVYVRNEHVRMNEMVRA